MNEIDELVALADKIAAAKERGERITRNFWGVVAIFGFFVISWIFFIPKSNPGLNNYPFYFIGAFGLVTILVLVTKNFRPYRSDIGTRSQKCFVAKNRYFQPICFISHLRTYAGHE